jgi:hypothetical protein
MPPDPFRPNLDLRAIQPARTEDDQRRVTFSIQFDSFEPSLDRAAGEHENRVRTREGILDDKESAGEGEETREAHGGEKCGGRTHAYQRAAEPGPSSDRHEGGISSRSGGAPFSPARREQWQASAFDQTYFTGARALS